MKNAEIKTLNSIYIALHTNNCKMLIELIPSLDYFTATSYIREYQNIFVNLMASRSNYEQYKIFETQLNGLLHFLYELSECKNKTK